MKKLLKHKPSLMSVLPNDPEEIFLSGRNPFRGKKLSDTLHYKEAGLTGRKWTYSDQTTNKIEHELSEKELPKFPQGRVHDSPVIILENSQREASKTLCCLLR
jgi:hypothetical protein